MGMNTILIVGMVLEMYTYVKMYQIVHFKMYNLLYISYIPIKLFKRKSYYPA